MSRNRPRKQTTSGEPLSEDRRKERTALLELKASHSNLGKGDAFWALAQKWAMLNLELDT
jgi:hypothetical protein